MQSFALNNRRPQLQDPRVRRAFNLAFNFEQANKTLLYGEYQRVGSYFDESELKATGLPQGRELEILNEVRDQVPPEVFLTGRKPRQCWRRRGRPQEPGASRQAAGRGRLQA